MHKKSDIDFTSFDLPFFEEVTVEDMNTDVQYEKMESMIPKDAKYIDSVDTFTQGYKDWNTKFDIYIIPYDKDGYNWALFRLNWDDNFMKWNWVGDVRSKSEETDPFKATVPMLRALFEKWDIDLEDPENEVIRDMI
jgi:hypothetical protein